MSDPKPGGVDRAAQAKNTLDMAADSNLSASDASRAALIAMASVQATLGVCDRLDRLIELMENPERGAASREQHWDRFP